MQKYGFNHFLVYMGQIHTVTQNSWNWNRKTDLYLGGLHGYMFISSCLLWFWWGTFQLESRIYFHVIENFVSVNAPKRTLKPQSGPLSGHFHLYLICGRGLRLVCYFGCLRKDTASSQMKKISLFCANVIT